MTFKDKANFPFWEKLTEEEKKVMTSAMIGKCYKKGQTMLNGAEECVGLFTLISGQIRIYIISEDGKEITLYRLIEGDTCIMGAKCMISNMTFQITIDVEEDTEIAIIPTPVYEKISDKNMHVKNYTLELVSSKFSEVMWVLEQLVFSNMGKRLRDCLIDQASLKASNTINITHEQIANDLGSAREVITRLLKQFQLEGLIKISRNTIEIIDYGRLSEY